MTAIEQIWEQALGKLHEYRTCGTCGKFGIYQPASQDGPVRFICKQCGVHPAGVLKEQLPTDTIIHADGPCIVATTLKHGHSVGMEGITFPNKGAVVLTIIRKGVAYSFKFDPAEADSVRNHLAQFTQKSFREPLADTHHARHRPRPRRDLPLGKETRRLVLHQGRR